MRKATLIILGILLTGIFLLSSCSHNYWKGRGVKHKYTKTDKKVK